MTKLCKLLGEIPGIGSVAVVLLAGLQIGQVLLTLLCFPPHLPVEHAHNGDGSVKSRDGRPERDVFIGPEELDETLICTRTFKQKVYIVIKWYRIYCVHQFSNSIKKIYNILRKFFYFFKIYTIRSLINTASFESVVRLIHFL